MGRTSMTWWNTYPAGSAGSQGHRNPLGPTDMNAGFKLYIPTQQLNVCGSRSGLGLQPLLAPVSRLLESVAI